MSAEKTDAATECDARQIASALEQVVRLYYSRSFCHDLKPAQWHALRYFAGTEPGNRTITAFARQRASTMGTASTTVSTLVRKGLLARSADGTSARNLGLHVTPAGLELLEDDPINALVASLDGLPVEERTQVQEALAKLVTDLERTPATESATRPRQ